MLEDAKKGSQKESWKKLERGRIHLKGFIGEGEKSLKKLGRKGEVHFIAITDWVVRYSAHVTCFAVSDLPRGNNSLLRKFTIGVWYMLRSFICVFLLQE
jgi:hypothetical protein